MSTSSETAGLRAAIAERQAGGRVAVPVKGKLGRIGSSAMTTAGCAAAFMCANVERDDEASRR